MTQIKVKTVTVRSVINRKEFARGFADGRAGAPWPKTIDTTWDYERGRQFGILYPNTPLKFGRQVTNVAVHDFYTALSDGSIL